MSEGLDATLRRLKQERDEADRRYNDALTAVDRALPGLPAIADPLLGLDEHQLSTLNDAWNTLPEPPATGGGLRGRLRALVWGTVAPYLQRQLTFNSVLVDHINRGVEAQKAAHRRQVEATAAVRDYLSALSVLHSTLMVYLQQITAYVDTKDREMSSGALVLNAALSGMTETNAKYHETLNAREHRVEARVRSLASAHEELRGIVGVAQHAIAALKRHVEEGSGGAIRSNGSGGSAGSEGGRAFAPSLDAYKYVGFEDQFRGSREEILERQRSYLTHFQGLTADVLDIGCGRGEFIDLLIANGIPARGVDLNHEMAEVCRARGLNVTEIDAVTYLSELPDESLGGIFAAQVVEHLEPAYLLRMLDLAFLKLQPGGVMVLETLNPACWTAFFESYIRDITHRWPLHPETLKYLVQASGFTTTAVEFRSPIPERNRLQPIRIPTGADGALREIAEIANANMAMLNDRMFSHMDYAIVARR